MMGEPASPLPTRAAHGLRATVMGIDRGAALALIGSIEARIAAAERELAELEREIGELEAEIATHEEHGDLEATIELSRQVAAGVVSDARKQYERAVSEARRQAAEIEQARAEELDQLRREIGVLRAQVERRRVRLERALRSALEELEADASGPGVESALRPFRAERTEV